MENKNCDVEQLENFINFNIKLKQLVGNNFYLCVCNLFSTLLIKSETKLKDNIVYFGDGDIKSLTKLLYKLLKYIVPEKKIDEFIVLVVFMQFEKIFVEYNIEYYDKKKKDKVWYYSTILETFYILLLINKKYHDEQGIVSMNEWAQIVFYKNIKLINITFDELLSFELDVLNRLHFSLYVEEENLFEFYQKKQIDLEN